jgi:predicted CopG family antitoxin
VKTEKYLNANIVTIAHMAQLMTKRIPVSEDLWKQLGRIKQAGQTYDELLGEMIRAFNRRELARLAQSAKKGEGNWHKLEDA